ncbi:hypothetical protein Q5M85_06435 [Paraclostridium bifermentans]|nr:hypothetical protein [Paraclostridium bifermentans]
MIAFVRRAKEWALNFQKTLWESVENVDVDIELKDGDNIDCCGGVEIIETHVICQGTYYNLYQGK